MTSVITATALVVRPPDGTAGSAYREIGRVRSRTSTIRMTSLARFHPPTTTLSCSEASSFRTAVAIAQRCLAKAIFQIAALPHADMAQVPRSLTELTSRWVCERWRFQCRNRRSAADKHWHPVRCVPRRSRFARLALKVVNLRKRREAHTIVQAVHINDRARSGRRFRDCRDEDTATTADQKITGARSEAIVLDKRPIIRPHLEQPFEVRNHARTMAAAERACARPQRIVFGPLR